jgi:hypothetical protein
MRLHTYHQIVVTSRLEASLFGLCRTSAHELSSGSKTQESKESCPSNLDLHAFRMASLPCATDSCQNHSNSSLRWGALNYTVLARTCVKPDGFRPTPLLFGILKPPEARRVDRKIRAVFVSGAGNTGQIGMLTASTRSANYVDLHKGSNYL